MSKKIDPQSLNSAVIDAVNAAFLDKADVGPTADPVIFEKELIEYDSLMRVFPMEKFNGPAYAAVFNYYKTQKDLDEKAPVGTFIFIVKEDMAEKVAKSLGCSSRDAEKEDVLMMNVGEFGKVAAEGLRVKLRSLVNADLVMSEPIVYKNNIPGGVSFDYDLYEKQEIIFSFGEISVLLLRHVLGLFNR